MNEVDMQAFYDSCVDAKGRLVYSKLLEYLIATNNFMNCGGRLYHFDEQYGYWCDITNEVPSLSIRSYIPRERQTLLEASQIKKIVANLIDSAAIVGELKSRPEYMNLENGVLELATMTLLKHSRDYGFTYVNRCNYLPDAKLEDATVACQYLRTSLGVETVESEEVQQVLEMLGYAISELRLGEKAFLLLGESNCGKSVLLKLLEGIYAPGDISNVGLHEMDSPFRFAALANSRINLLHEVKPVRITCVDQFKQVVSSEDVIAEEKGKKPIRVQSKAVLVSAANTMPDFAGVELNNSLTNRLAVIRFMGVIAQENVNRNLLQELKGERDILFSVAVKTLPELIKNQFRFTVPASTAEFMGAYARSLNSVALFIEECCEVMTGAKVFSRTLYSAYGEFAKNNVLYLHSEHVFGMQVRSLRNVVNKKIRIGKISLQGYEGIALKSN